MIDIDVALPDSLLTERPDLLSKTEKVGAVARACAMFAVRRIFIFRDRMDGSPSDGALMQDLLNYIRTAPYLRRRAYRLSKEYSYVGRLPPLNIPLHQVKPEIAGDGEIREAYIINGSMADVGLGEPLPLVRGEGATSNGLALVRVNRKGGSFVAREVTSSPIYRGYEVRTVDGLDKVMSGGGPYDLMIATSRYGRPVSSEWNGLLKAARDGARLLVAFGSPRRGLQGIIGKEVRERFTWLCTIEDQKVKTVRTEEALLATLSMVRLAANISAGGEGHGKGHG
ncbi:MAG: methylase [Nitrososphaerota archaeon]|jgi:predicted SPOUT superfamily RNA methylase MTH1|nr:methylase [Nitrososphaerota archaeon]